MTDHPLTDEIRGFFQTYNTTFASMDGGRIAALYSAPTITMRADGSIHCLQSREELAQFFGNVVDTYQRDGYHSGRFKNLEVASIGGRSAVATMDWELLRGDGSVLRGWRQSYNLVRGEGGWRILVSTFHVA